VPHRGSGVLAGNGRARSTPSNVRERHWGTDQIPQAGREEYGNTRTHEGRSTIVVDSEPATD
jgi:hypothetical protein